MKSRRRSRRFLSQFPRGRASLPPKDVRGHILGDPEAERCREFRLQFGELPQARVDPLYALPLELIKAIDAWRPKWLTAEEICFEQKLAEFSAKHHVFGIAEDTFVSNSVLADDIAAAIERDMKKEFGENANVAFAVEGAEKLARERAKALPYLGWLLTNHQYVSERDALRTQRKSQGHQVSFRTACGHPTDAALQQFWERWQLTGMKSWELPVPQGANRSGAAWPSSITEREGMVNISIPVTQSLASADPIREEIEAMRRQTRPAHLAQWLDVLERRGGNKGPSHYAQLFKVHWFWNLVLRARYGERMRVVRGKLEVALGKLLFISSNRVQQLRYEVDRRLRAGDGNS